MKSRSDSGRRGAVIGAVIIAGVLHSGLSWSAEVKGGEITPGDTFIGKIDGNISAVSVEFFVTQGTTVDVSVKAEKKTALEPSIELRDDSGAPLDTGNSLLLKGGSARLVKFPIPATGNYTLLVFAVTGTGGFTAKTKAKPPAKSAAEGCYPGDDTVVFEAPPGSLIKFNIKADSKLGDYQPVIESAEDRGGALALAGNVIEKGTKAGFKNVVAPAGGAVTITLGGSGAGCYAAKASIKAPKSKETFDLSAIQPLGILAGKVTNELTGDPIEGATVTLNPPAVQPIVTSAAGEYSAEVLEDIYDVTFSHPLFDSLQATVEVITSETTTLNSQLMPVSPVVVTAAVSGNAVPDGTMAGSMTVVILDGSSIQGYSWAQLRNAAAVIDGADTLAPAITLAGQAAYKAELFRVLAEPPVAADELPPNVPLPEGEFSGGIPNRFQVAGISPFSLHEAGIVIFEAAVTTSSGTYKDEVEVPTALPWKPATGVQNVPLGLPVLLHGRAHVDEDKDGANDITGLPAVYDWALQRPGGSAAALDDPAGQNPEFVPDVAGKYTVTVTNTTELPGNQLITLEIYAGSWSGVVTGQDASGRLLAANCTGCHNGGLAPDKFTPWSQSGHAEIFTKNLDTSAHYGEDCFPCHTVGFNQEVDNGGFDNAADYPAFLASGLLGQPGDNWTTVLNSYPGTAKLANIQCENCHGPQIGSAHMKGAVRFSLSAAVCGTCHGEPARHARYQQWQLSGHANYPLAVEEGESGSCSRCHTANGFLTWLPILLDNDPATDPLAEITVAWTRDQIHPQTCVACHDPHLPGSASGDDPEINLRITGNTPPLIAGFTATDVGHGALCMTCHNTRRGLRNDGNFDAIAGTGETSRAPHPGAQADVLMGQNAYLVTVGNRSKHSLTANVEHTCVTCHMEKTQPPDPLSYNHGGTNHTFFASTAICSGCHTGITANLIQDPVETKLHELKSRLESAILAAITAQTGAGNKVKLSDAVTVAGAGAITAIEFTEYHGRQAITATLIDSSTVGPVGLNDVRVLDAADADLGDLYKFTSAALPKSGWNYILIHNDESKGVHNPSFVNAVLNASIEALSALLVP